MRNYRWRRDFTASFVIGFGCWLLMYATYWQIGKFDIIGIQTGLGAWWILIQMTVGFFLGSLINDLITRGFIIHMLIGRLSPFSLILGCSLTFSFYKSGSVWADTGIHFGLNIAYGLFYGLIGKAGDGLLLITNGEISLLLNNTVLLSFASLLFLAMFFYYRKRKMSILDEEKTGQVVGNEILNR